MPKKLIEEKLSLVSALAEEIGNPLTAINARLYTLQKALKKDSPEQKNLCEIIKEIKRLETILTQFLLDYMANSPHRSSQE